MPSALGGSSGERPYAGESELPETYGRSRVVVLAIDPYHVHVYWEITPADSSDARERVDRFGLVTPTWVLRFYDVTGVDGAAQSKALVGHAHFDVEIEPSSRSWYVELWSPNKTYVVELGIRISNRFSAVCRAKPVHVPPADPSPPEAPEWRKADPVHATTHCVAEAELPAYGVSASDQRARVWEPGSGGTERRPLGGAFAPESLAPDLTGEQPWVLATAGLTGEGSGVEPKAASPGVPPAPWDAATFAALPHTGGGAEGLHAAGPEPSRSVSLLAQSPATGQRLVSGGARAGSASGGDSSE